ncbi:MAG: DUF1833 family protein [Legionella sp.]|nr:DUF1833 family protein [Legionella sp.]
MPDPTLTEAWKEAAALAPDGEIPIDTLELRHPDFVDDDGNPDSAWLTTNQTDITAPLEDDAPVKGGQDVVFRAIAFSFKLARIEPGSGAAMEIAIDSTDRRIVEALDRAVVSPIEIILCYRPYLSHDLEGGPQMIPPKTFVLSNAAVGTLRTTGRARVAIDLAGAFPRDFYTAVEYPGLLNQ